MSLNLLRLTNVVSHNAASRSHLTRSVSPLPSFIRVLGFGLCICVIIKLSVSFNIIIIISSSSIST